MRFKVMFEISYIIREVFIFFSNSATHEDVLINEKIPENLILFVP